MHDKVEKLLSSTSHETFTTIARGALVDSTATVTETPTFKEITTSHNDQRTIGIVKVSGNAKVTSGTKPWSSVVKIIDPNIDEGDADRWVSVDVEQHVYEQKLFGSDDEDFRPAKSYLVEINSDDIRVLWLEDMPDAIQPPWDFASYLNAANHLGSFNGKHANSIKQLPFS